MDRTLTSQEVDFIVESLKAAKVELEELERELEWYISIVPEQLEQAIEVILGNASTV